MVLDIDFSITHEVPNPPKQSQIPCIVFESLSHAKDFALDTLTHILFLALSFEHPQNHCEMENNFCHSYFSLVINYDSLW